jgi:hypothetical protein
MTMHLILKFFAHRPMTFRACEKNWPLKVQVSQEEHYEHDESIIAVPFFLLRERLLTANHLERMGRKAIGLRFNVELTDIS